MDMPLAESAITGFALGASQTGSRPIIEFQFADFSTESVTQLGSTPAHGIFEAVRKPRCLSASLRRRHNAGCISFRRI